MSKTIIISRYFPRYHIRPGEPTFFVEAIWKALANIHYSQSKYVVSDYKELLNIHHNGINYYDETLQKFHTIRKGKRWKEGDRCSLRIWGDDINPKSGRKGPYHSKQIAIAPDLKILKVSDIDIYPTNEIFINGKFFCTFGSENHVILANGDGLNIPDMNSWFNKLPFTGQIIFWSYPPHFEY